MITLLGVGHVFDLSQRIREEVHLRHPSVVGLEIDEGRYQALLNQGHGSRGGPVTYRVLALAQRAIAQEYGNPVGGEMIAGVGAAHEIGAKVAFIDLDARQIWGRLWRAMSLWEKVRLLLTGLVGFVGGAGRVEEELQRYQNDSEGYLKELGRQFPSLHRVLIDERNDRMASALRQLHEGYGDVVAIVGDGHVDGIAKRLEGLPMEVLRLWDLRRPHPEGHSFSLSFDLHRPGPQP